SSMTTVVPAACRDSERCDSHSAMALTLSQHNDKRIKQTNKRQTSKTTYRVFGKRLLRTSQFVVSSRIWLHTIPTRNCDVLMTFPANTEDAKLMWLLKQLREKAPQIIVHVRHHSKTEVFGFYMTASYQSLLKGADNLCIRKPLKQDYGGGMKEFTYDEQDLFENIHNELDFFTSQERQSIVYGMLNNIRSAGNERINDIVFRDGQAIIPTLLTHNVIAKVFPLHNNDNLMQLRNGWVNAFCKTQPLNEICEYFGVKIAMYFAFLGHYTTALCIPALLGLVMWTMEGYEQTFDDWCFVGFALFNVLWATLYLEHWKRRSAELAYKWGTLDKNDEVNIDPRPFYKGELEVSSVTGRLEPFYPIWKRNLFRYFVTVPVVILCLGIVFIVMLANFYIEDLITKLVDAGEYAFIAKVFPKVCHAASIFTLDRMYTRVAYWLNDMENYRMQEAYENHLIIKLVLFQFVNSFLSLFYIAFYLQDMELLREQLMALLIMRQLIGNVKEALLPYLMWHFRMIKAGLITTAAESPEKEWDQAAAKTGPRKQDDISDMSTRMGAVEIVEEKQNNHCGANVIDTPENNGETHLENNCRHGEASPVDGGTSCEDGTQPLSHEEVSDSKDYTEQPLLGKVDASKDYTEQPLLGEVSDSKDYTEQSLLGEVSDSKDYTEQPLLGGVSDSRDYTEQPSLEGVSDSKNYIEPPTHREVDDTKGYIEPPTHGEVDDSKDYMEPPTHEGMNEAKDPVQLPPRKPSTTNSPSQAEVESTMSEYEDTFEDYLEMFIQFGYVTLFSSAFPLAALCALMNNVIEIRSDAFKLCMTCRRPFGQQVENIGSWADALMLMGILAVIVNCALIGVFGHMTRIVPGLDSTSYLFLIIVLEHVILAVKMWIAYAIPDIPQWVATEMSRLDFLRREAFKKLDCHSTPKQENTVRSQSLPPTSNHSHPSTMSIGDTSYITRPSTFHQSLDSHLRHRQTQSQSATNS
ncbi:anoctamin-8-like isoform X2, partial [Argonauta hians]